MKQCPRCGRTYSDIVKQCPACSATLIKIANNNTPNVNDIPPNPNHNSNLNFDRDSDSNTVFSPFDANTVEDNNRNQIPVQKRKPPKKQKSHKPLRTLGIALAAIIVIILGGLTWYTQPWKLLSTSKSTSPSVILDSISGGGYHTVAVKHDGTVVATKLPDDFEYNSGQCDVADWNHIIKISAGLFHTIGLKDDGTVVAVGFNEFGECKLESWTDIIDIGGGAFYTIGLKNDGTVEAIGNNSYGQCNVNEWTDIAAISAGFYHTVGLKKNGTVISTQLPNDSEDNYGQDKVTGWTNIVAVSAGSYHTVGLKKNGTVVAVGSM